MPLDVGVWRVDGAIRRLSASGMPSEERLEDLLEADPAVLGQPLMIVGRQVPTAHGKRVDLLAVDADGVLHVLELKRDRTPRDVVAQVLDYGSWVRGLSHDDVLDMYREHGPGGVAFEAAFADAFGIDVPEELNTGHRLTIVAGDLDPESERIVAYLADEYGVSINVAFFRYFADGDRAYVTRTWLVEQATDPAPGGRARRGAAEAWNGTDWYVSFGHEDSGVRSWQDARRLGFVSAGGGDWYARSLRTLPEGGRVWVHIPRSGYVGTGVVSGIPQRFSESAFARDPDLLGTYAHANGEDEWVVPVAWDATLPADQAFWRKGMFANQNSACRLRNAYTLQSLHDSPLGGGR